MDPARSKVLKAVTHDAAKLYLMNALKLYVTMHYPRYLIIQDKVAFSSAADGRECREGASSSAQTSREHDTVVPKRKHPVFLNDARSHFPLTRPGSRPGLLASTVRAT